MNGHFSARGLFSVSLFSLLSSALDSLSTALPKLAICSTNRIFDNSTSDLKFNLERPGLSVSISTFFSGEKKE